MGRSSMISSEAHGVTLPTSLTGCENAYYTPVRRGADKCGRLECMRTSPNLEISTACQYPPGSQYGEEPIGSYWRNRLYRSHLLFSEEETFRDGRDRMCLPGHINLGARKLLSVAENLTSSTSIDDFLKAIGHGSPHPAAVFVDSMNVLLSSPHPSIVKGTLSFIDECLYHCSDSNCLALVSSKLIPRICSTPHLLDLSVIDDLLILRDILLILKNSLRLASLDAIQSLSARFDTEPKSIRNVVLHEVLIPIEPSLVQISHNPHLLSWKDGYRETFIFLNTVFEMIPFHQPTLDFICSSRIPIAFQSLLSKVDDEYTHQFVIWLMTRDIRYWKEEGAETWYRGRILLQTLEQEGFHEEIEQTLLHNKSTEHGSNVRTNSFDILNYLGINSPKPR
ncbi:hypothetical protein BLNAU_3208 [Blattamonas nauphoetae]|uniref:Uncharacterized protein n=1 Tax=Blattamonas nauphoetae TaxID=2049346 RepID=A0ABQ9YDD6_9EUKA|nr:hypothetical protein BLNAU_3208 [Blattamonas nauphoetae]